MSSNDSWDACPRISQFYASTFRDGMKGLMSPMPNATTAISATDLATCNSVLSKSKVDAAE